MGADLWVPPDSTALGLFQGCGHVSLVEEFAPNHQSSPTTQTNTRSPSALFPPFFGGEGSSTKTDYRRSGALLRTSQIWGTQTNRCARASRAVRRRFPVSEASGLESRLEELEAALGLVLEVRKRSRRGEAVERWDAVGLAGKPGGGPGWVV